jgi:CubicO group peptidase (beta-lactamase class C family)
MIKIRKQGAAWTVLLFLVGLLLGAAFHAGARAGAPALQGQANFGDQMESQMPALLEQYRVPGAVAAYIQDGQVLWTRAYGVANRRSGEPMSPEMVFNFGSCGKVLTAWGVMRLVEQGKLSLDAPANQYLKRWRLESDQFNPDEVTIRRLLSHTAGLTVHGYSDYGPRRSLPSLAQLLDGANQGDGRVFIQWQPGTVSQYSGGGFVILEMIIEDVTGEPFAAFMEREVTTPLGMASLQWTWTPESIAEAAVPHGPQGEPVGYRLLASKAIGSEVGTVTDFARFVAAAVPGPGGEPAGRGVLQPDTIRQMIEVQPPAAGNTGLAYGIVSQGGDTWLMHFGSNPGWNAFFILSVDRREGLVVATNSSNGFEFNTAIQDLWSRVSLGRGTNVFPPAAPALPLPARIGLGFALVFAVPLLAAGLVFFIQIRRGARRFAGLDPRRLWLALPWAVLAAFWWYWIYSPIKLFFPTTIPDFWPIPQTAYVMAVLLAWLGFSVVAAFSRKTRLAE